MNKYEVRVGDVNGNVRIFEVYAKDEHTAKLSVMKLVNNVYRISATIEKDSK